VQGAEEACFLKINVQPTARRSPATVTKSVDFGSGVKERPLLVDESLVL